MVRTEHFKYAVYDIGKHRESLVHMDSDPHEMHNVARASEHYEVLETHRDILRGYARETGDIEAIEILNRP